MKKVLISLIVATGISLSVSAQESSSSVKLAANTAEKPETVEKSM